MGKNMIPLDSKHRWSKLFQSPIEQFIRQLKRRQPNNRHRTGDRQVGLLVFLKLEFLCVNEDSRSARKKRRGKSTPPASLMDTSSSVCLDRLTASIRSRAA